jgi:hypothetical protein
MGKKLQTEESMGRASSVVLVFPELPYSELNPNNLRRSHWSKRSEVSAIAREEAKLLGLQAVRAQGVVGLPFQTCKIEEVFYVPTRRKIDIENLMAACKAWCDGIVDAGILVDDGWEHVLKLSGRVIYRKGVEGTEITIKEVSDVQSKRKGN